MLSLRNAIFQEGGTMAVGVEATANPAVDHESFQLCGKVAS